MPDLKRSLSLPNMTKPQSSLENIKGPAITDKSPEKNKLKVNLVGVTNTSKTQVSAEAVKTSGSPGRALIGANGENTIVHREYVKPKSYLEDEQKHFFTHDSSKIIKIIDDFRGPVNHYIDQNEAKQNLLAALNNEQALNKIACLPYIFSKENTKDLCGLTQSVDEFPAQKANLERLTANCKTSFDRLTIKAPDQSSAGKEKSYNFIFKPEEYVKHTPDLSVCEICDRLEQFIDDTHKTYTVIEEIKPLKNLSKQDCTLFLERKINLMTSLKKESILINSFHNQMKFQGITEELREIQSILSRFNKKHSDLNLNADMNSCIKMLNAVEILIESSHLSKIKFSEVTGAIDSLISSMKNLKTAIDLNKTIELPAQTSHTETTGERVPNLGGPMQSVITTNFAIDENLSQIRYEKLKLKAVEVSNHLTEYGVTDSEVIAAKNEPLNMEKTKTYIWEIDPSGTYRFKMANKHGIYTVHYIDNLLNDILARFF